MRATGISALLIVAILAVALMSGWLGKGRLSVGDFQNDEGEFQFSEAQWLTPFSQAGRDLPFLTHTTPGKPPAGEFVRCISKPEEIIRVEGLNARVRMDFYDETLREFQFILDIPNDDRMEQFDRLREKLTKRYGPETVRTEQEGTILCRWEAEDTALELAVSKEGWPPMTLTASHNSVNDLRCQEIRKRLAGEQ